ncbi:MAG: VOC family protein [Phycisphaerales bacterium]
MSNQPQHRVGQICWHDLTVENAEAVRDFYTAVIGLKSSDQSMGDYNDFNMLEPDSGECVAGVCHARGSNADIPPQWLTYFWVADFEQSIRTCAEQGGAVVSGPKTMGDMSYAVIRDPAGAVCAIIGR